MPMRPRVLLTIAAGLALVAALVVGLSQAPKTDTSPKANAFSLAKAQRALAGAPAPLAALHAQASELLPGGKQTVRARLAALKGTPVLVNKWASWCGPCRAEFPFLQDASTRYGKQVAFLGLNSGDNRGNAASFLKKFPVPYPSVEDPKEQAAGALHAFTAYPVTIFFDAQGKQVFTHAGLYSSQEQLDADVEKYLLRKQ